MTKPTPVLAQEALLEFLSKFPDGVGIEAIETGLAAAPTRRSLQRWLSALIVQNKIHKLGKGRATLYRHGAAQEVSGSLSVQVTLTGDLQVHFQLSPEATEIRDYVQQPMARRDPVGYRRSFLDDYRPNISAYLPEPIRAELRGHGQVALDDAPAGTYARQIANRLLIDLSWNSSRLEGNTYSLLETERLLSEGAAANGKNAQEATMILNHKDAIEFLIGSADEIGFNAYTVLNLHAQLSDNLLPDPGASGRLRSIAVGIGQSVFHPLEGPHRIKECFHQVLDTAAAIDDPFEQAFFAMVHLPYLQPFDDVNKRVSRLAANIPLIRSNLCPLSFIDLAPETYTAAMLGVYELNRIELLREVFVWAYKRSCRRYAAVRQSLGEPDHFRVVHRTLIAETVSDVVRAGLNKLQTVVLVKRVAVEHIQPDEQARFIEVIEGLLLNLHEGSIARYRLRPSEFHAWQATWH